MQNRAIDFEYALEHGVKQIILAYNYNKLSATAAEAERNDIIYYSYRNTQQQQQRRRRPKRRF